ncbi:MAG TPA: hypothetical protein VGN57_04590 [Pirellulaceae bacterium]|jgi:hypothetical protein|nr:hypothetical protein [Pirellulaceae bacterium]
MLKAFMKLFSQTPANEAEERRALMAFRLLRQERVQTRMILGVEQRSAIERYVHEARKTLKADVPGTNDVASDDRTRRGPALLQKTAVQVMHAVERDNILTPQQMEMLRQLCYKRQGLQAFSDPSVIAALELTPEQSTAIQAQIAELPAAGRRAPGESAEEQEGRRSRRRDSLDKILGTLTEPQRAKWVELTGDSARRRSRGIGRRREGGRPVRRGANRGYVSSRPAQPVPKSDADELSEG